MELYKSLSHQVVTMAAENFMELYLWGNRRQMAKIYFQPRALLYGKSYCSFEFPTMKKRIQNLKQALIKNTKSNHLPVRNCAISDIDAERALDNYTTYASMLRMNNYQNFAYDLNCRTIIQMGLDKNYAKMVQLIVDHVLTTVNDISLQEVILTDLP